MEALMQLCILGFDGSHSADDALGEVLEAQGDSNRWLLEVGTIARPLIGRVRVSVTFPDGQSKTFREGDLAKASADLGAYTGYYVSALAGPYGSIAAAADAASTARAYGSAAEQRLFHIDDIKKVLPRDSSALVLIAKDDICDVLIELFKPYTAKVVRVPVDAELRARLDALENRVVQQSAQAQGAAASP
jgi:uncharacterized membrane protein